MKLFLNVNLSWPEVEDVYSIGYRGQAVGKVWFATDRRHDATPWEWHLCIPMTLPDSTKGVAASKNDALQDLANSLHTLILHTPPERLERAFAFSAASGLGFDTGDVIEVVVEDLAARRSIEPAEPVEPVEPPPSRAVPVEALPKVAQAVQPRTVAPQAPAAVTATGQPPGFKPVLPAQKLKPTVRVIKMTKVNQGPVQAGGSQLPVNVASPDASAIPPPSDASSP